MHPEMETLQAENRRLSALVAALAEKNLRLEEALAQTRRHIEVEEGPLLPFPRDIEVNNGHSTSIQIQQEGEYDLSTPFSYAKEVQQPHSTSFQSQQDQEQPQNTSLQFRKEVEQESSTPSLNRQALLESLPAPLRTQLEQDLADSTYHRQREAILAAAPTATQLLETLKREAFRSYRNTHVAAAAHLLLRICAVGDAPLPYASIQALLHFTDTGAYKLLRNLQQKGLVVKQGRQQYRLTERALELMQEAARQE
jgi:hypothetical protein